MFGYIVQVFWQAGCHSNNSVNGRNKMVQCGGYNAQYTDTSLSATSDIFIQFVNFFQELTKKECIFWTWVENLLWVLSLAKPRVHMLL